MRLILSKEATAAILSSLHAAICTAEGDVEFWSREDLEIDPEVQRACLEHAEGQLRERMGSLAAFREACGQAKK